MRNIPLCRGDKKPVSIESWYVCTSTCRDKNWNLHVYQLPILAWKFLFCPCCHIQYLSIDDYDSNFLKRSFANSILKPHGLLPSILIVAIWSVFLAYHDCGFNALLLSVLQNYTFSFGSQRKSKSFLPAPGDGA